MCVRRQRRGEVAVAVRRRREVEIEETLPLVLDPPKHYVSTLNPGHIMGETALFELPSVACSQGMEARGPGGRHVRLEVVSAPASREQRLSWREPSRAIIELEKEGLDM
jgi:hypothetical protein